MLTGLLGWSRCTAECIVQEGKFLVSEKRQCILPGHQSLTHHVHR